MEVKAWDNEIFVDERIPNISANDDDNNVVDGCYLKVGNKYYLIQSYDKDMGLIKCQSGDELKWFPAGTHYAIYTSRFWTPYYYFRVHTIPKLEVSAEFHERRRLQNEPYNTELNCIENTCNGILFDAHLSGDAHSAVKYHYWDIIDAKTGRTVFKTEKIYSQEMECEAFVPFGHEYIGKITVITQDGITLRGEAEYYLPASPAENDKKFSLRAYQNRFGGVELAWDYSYWYDGGSLLKATDFEVFRVDKRLNKVKYLGKVDCSPVGIEGVSPAASGHNWWLIDKDCDFTLRTPVGAKINMYLVGGGCDGGSWDIVPNSLNESFAVGQNGGDGGYFNKKSIICESGVFEGHAKIAERNKPAGTIVKTNGVTYKCNGEGSQRRGKVSSNTMEQSADYHVVYNDNAKNGVDGFATPYGIVGSSGGGGAACGGNRTNGDLKELSVSGVTPKYNKGNWLLIDRESLGGESGEFELSIPEGATVRMHLVGGGCDGGRWYAKTVPGNSYQWDVNWSVYKPGGEGGYVLTKELPLSGKVHCNVKIADTNDVDGTTADIGGNVFRCNDDGSKKTLPTNGATVAKYETRKPDYKDAPNGADGVETYYGFVGSSGGGGGGDNMIKIMNPGRGGKGAGKGGSAAEKPPTKGEKCHALWLWRRWRRV